MTRKSRIELLISQHLPTAHYDVINESINHHVPPNSETHFKLIIISSDFDSLSKVARHRLINKLLADEFHHGLHALSLSLHTPAEWKAHGGSILNSPACRDGYRHN